MEEQLQRIGNKITCPVVFIIRDGKVLMGLRHYTPDKWTVISVWTIPGGRCDEGETLEVTLRRETEEETGIKDLRIEKYLGEVLGANEGDVVPAFVGSTDEEASLIEPEKSSEWRWFSPDEIPENFNQALLGLLKEYLRVE